MKEVLESFQEISGGLEKGFREVSEGFIRLSGRVQDSFMGFKQRLRRF